MIFLAAYNPTIEVKKANQIVKIFGIFIAVIAIGVIFMTLKDNYKQPILANKGVEKIQTEKKPKQSIDQKN